MTSTSLEVVREKLSQISREGFAVPSLDGLACKEVSGNLLIAPPKLIGDDQLYFSLGNGRDNIIVVGERPVNSFRFVVKGVGNFFSHACECTFGGLINLYVDGSGNTVHIGKNCNINGLGLVEVGDNQTIEIGDDCLFSHGVTIRTHDQHGIVDLSTYEPVNRARSVHIEPHVWLGRDASIHAGVTIGFGSIVGERSIVKKDVPRRTVVAGIPAKVVRENVSWVHAIEPSPGWPERFKSFAARVGCDD